MICPEGTSVSTEESPVPFKMGAFKLAVSVQPEPYIVPIAVANFDKKISSEQLTAVIHPPFKVSEMVEDPSDDEQLIEFVKRYSQTFVTYVQEAIAISKVWY